MDLFRSYTIEVDGEVRGVVANGATETIEIGPGKHSVRMTIDWCGSRSLEVEGDTVLKCRAGANPLIGLFYITLFRNAYIVLERA